MTSDDGDRITPDGGLGGLRNACDGARVSVAPNDRRGGVQIGLSR